MDLIFGKIKKNENFISVVSKKSLLHGILQDLEITELGEWREQKINRAFGYITFL